MSAVHISIATSGKLRPELKSIPVNDEAARVEWHTQVTYHQYTLGYQQISSNDGLWCGDNGNSVVTITCDKQGVK